jgi:hypothetical protein
MKNLHSEELHDLYRGLKVCGWLNERQWEYWDKRIRQENLNLNDPIQFETLKGRGTLRNLA